MKRRCQNWRGLHAPRRKVLWIPGLVLALLCWSPARAGDNLWTSSGPGGGNLTSLAFVDGTDDPSGLDSIYANSCSGIFKSTNGGDSWSQASEGLHTCGLISADTAGRVYATTNVLAEYYFTDDGGAAWNTVDLSHLDPTGLFDVRAIVPDPDDPSVLFLIPRYLDPAGGPSTVYYSGDSGGSWSMLAGGVGGASASTVTTFGIVSAPVLTLYVATTRGELYRWSETSPLVWDDLTTNLWGTENPQRIWDLVVHPLAPGAVAVVDRNGWVYASNDYGHTWSDTSAGLERYAVRLLALDPTPPGTILAAGSTSGRVYAYQNGWAEWQLISEDLPTDVFIWSLDVDPWDTTRVYATSQSGFWRSLDSAVSWAQANTGLRSFGAWEMAISPGTPTTLYAASANAGLAYSNDSGASWTERNDGLDDLSSEAVVISGDSTETVYASTWSQVWQWDETGSLWVPIIDDFALFGGSPAVSELASHPTNKTVVYAGSDSWISPYFPPSPLVFKYSGGVWTPLYTPSDVLPPEISSRSLYVPSMVVDTNDPQVIFAGTWESTRYTDGTSAYTSSILRSTDGGSSWETVLTADDATPTIATDPIHPGTVHVAISGRLPAPDRFFKSTAWGAENTWTELPLGDACVFNSLHVDPVVPNTLYLGCGPGVWVSRDAGSNWEMFDDNGLPLYDGRFGNFFDVKVAETDPPVLHTGNWSGVWSYTDTGFTETGTTTVDPVDSTTGEQPVSITFANVTVPGVTTLTTSTDPPPSGGPDGFLDGDVYFDISTTAVFEGLVTIQIDYSGTSLASLSEADQGELKLLHYDELLGDWVDSTTGVDAANDMIFGEVASLSPFAVGLHMESDGDGDTVPFVADFCPGTVIPEGVPTVRLGVNRWALVDGDTTFDTTSPPRGRRSPAIGFTIQKTEGCSCEQIIEQMGLEEGHMKFGCSTGAMRDWIAWLDQ